MFFFLLCIFLFVSCKVTFNTFGTELNSVVSTLSNRNIKMVWFILFLKSMQPIKCDLNLDFNTIVYMCTIISLSL